MPRDLAHTVSGGPWDRLLLNHRAGGNYWLMAEAQTTPPSSPPVALNRLTADQVAKFRIDGFVVVEDLLGREEVERLRRHSDLIAPGKAGHIPEDSTWFEEGHEAAAESDRERERVLSIFKLFNLAVRDAVMWRHATNVKIVEVVRDLLATDDIKMYGDQLFMKPPERGSAIPWHQDSASWCDMFPMDLVTAWTAIDHATEENGCLRFVPGTHRWGQLVGMEPHAGIRPDDVDPFDADLGGESWPIVHVPLRPGSVSFHHSLVLHSSSANTSGRRRRGYAVHYMRATTWRNPAVAGAPEMPPFKQVCGRSFPGRV